MVSVARSVILARTGCSVGPTAGTAHPRLAGGSRDERAFGATRHSRSPIPLASWSVGAGGTVPGPDTAPATPALSTHTTLSGAHGGLVPTTKRSLDHPCS